MDDQRPYSLSNTDSYAFRDLVAGTLSSTALGVLEQLTPQILQIYGLTELLDARLPAEQRDEHEEMLVNRVRRVVRLLPPTISTTPNEVFTAIEFLLYEIHEEPIRIGEAIIRLEALADEIRSRPMLHDLVMGRAN